MSEQLTAIEAATLAAAHDAAEGPGAFKALGFRHATDYVTDKTNSDGREVRRLTRTGRWLIDFPIFADAFANGMLTHRHVNELRKLDKPKVHNALVDSQAMLVDAAGECDFSDFLNVLIYWLNAADPDGREPIEQESRSGCTYRKHADGSVSGRFFFGPLSGQAFRRLLDHESQRLFRQDSENDVSRSMGARQGQALLNLMIRGFEAGGGDASITPLVSLVMGQELAENLVSRLAGETTEYVPPDHENLDRRCELDDGTPIHPNLAAVMLVAGTFRRMVFDSKSRPVDIAARSRRFPQWMRQVLLVRARGRCQIPGCDSPSAWLQADHVKPHSRGGPTELSNGQILCDPHNKWKRDE